MVPALSVCGTHNEDPAHWNTGTALALAPASGAVPPSCALWCLAKEGGGVGGVESEKRSRKAARNIVANRDGSSLRV